MYQRHHLNQHNRNEQLRHHRRLGDTPDFIHLILRFISVCIDAEETGRNLRARRRRSRINSRRLSFPLLHDDHTSPTIRDAQWRRSPPAASVRFQFTRSFEHDQTEESLGPPVRASVYMHSNSGGSRFSCVSLFRRFRGMFDERTSHSLAK